MIEPAGLLGIIPLHLTGRDGDARAGHQTSRIRRECSQQVSEQHDREGRAEIAVTIVHCSEWLGANEPLVELGHRLTDSLPCPLPKVTVRAVQLCGDGNRRERIRCRAQLSRGERMPRR